MDDSIAEQLDPAQVEAALDKMTTWLMTADARAAAGRELHRLGLGFYDPDDLLSDVAVRLLSAQLTGARDNPVGYARRALANRAIDLLRGQRAKPVVPFPTVGGDDNGDDVHEVDHPDHGALPDDLAVGHEAERSMRRGLLLHLSRVKAKKVWSVAAAVTTLTLSLHRDVELPADAPQPDGGSEIQADRWAALWLAGEGHHFPTSTGRKETNAIRKSRSRALDAIDAVLHKVATPLFKEDRHG